jgi:hypothetical protein
VRVVTWPRRAFCVLLPSAGFVGSSGSRGLGRVRCLRRFAQGEVCRGNGTSAVYTSAVIDFKCDPSTNGSKPGDLVRILKQQGQVGTPCTYFFEWNTAYACNTDNEAVRTAAPGRGRVPKHPTPSRKCCPADGL